MDERLNILSRWVEGIIGAPIDLEPASSDASFRRYFRIFCENQRTYIAMDAPPEHESVETFARAAGKFAALGLNVPLVYTMDTVHGFALLSDLGNRTYLDAIQSESAENLYQDALNTLWQLQTGSRDRLAAFEPYNADKLLQEMELFRQWFVPHRTSYKLSTTDHQMIDHSFRALIDCALGQPRVWVHRDYHSRNLMVVAENNPGVLDFQDAVTGPVTYDLVSLLRDCYVRWPAERVHGWLQQHFDAIRPSVVPENVHFEQFKQWFDWMGVQRHIKVLGIFSRLYHRDGKANYLDDLPLVYDYVHEICGEYKELRPFRSLLESMDTAWKS